MTVNEGPIQGANSIAASPFRHLLHAKLQFMYHDDRQPQIVLFSKECDYLRIR